MTDDIEPVESLDTIGTARLFGFSPANPKAFEEELARQGAGNGAGASAGQLWAFDSNASSPQGLKATDVAALPQDMRVAKAGDLPPVPQVQQVADTPKPQIGYGDSPGGVEIQKLSNLTSEQVSSRVNGHLDTYARTGDRASFGKALDLATAWRAQGGDSSGFDAIRARVGETSRDGLETKVAQQRADLLNKASGPIRALNRDNVNYGAQLYETLRNIGNSTDPDTSAYSAIRNSQVELRADISGVGASKSAALRGTMDAAGYGALFQEANRSIAQETAQQYGEERAKLAQMSPMDRAQYGAGKALDNGAGPEVLAASAIGMLGRGQATRPLRAPESEGGGGGKAVEGPERPKSLPEASLDPRTPEETRLITSMAEKGYSSAEIGNTLEVSRAKERQRIDELRRVDDPEKIAASLDKDKRFANRKMETEALLNDETQLRYDLEGANQTRESFDLMRKGDPKTGERKPLCFESYEQYHQFRTEFQAAVGGIKIDGKPVTAQAQVIGSATTFYSNNPDKPLGHHFDRNQLLGDRSDVDIDLYSPEMVRHMANLPNPSVNYKVMVAGEKTIFKSSGPGGLFSEFPALKDFAARWTALLGREVDVKLKVDIRSIKDLNEPTNGPIEFFRKEKN